eukprot:1162039-Pelagomonas_calceolata.AAC.3
MTYSAKAPSLQAEALSQCQRLSNMRRGWATDAKRACNACKKAVQQTFRLCNRCTQFGSMLP